jgi:hypothetical protein
MLILISFIGNCNLMQKMPEFIGFRAFTFLARLIFNVWKEIEARDYGKCYSGLIGKGLTSLPYYSIL